MPDWLHKWALSWLPPLPPDLPASPGEWILSCCLSAQGIHYFPFVGGDNGTQQRACRLLRSLGAFCPPSQRRFLGTFKWLLRVSTHCHCWPGPEESSDKYRKGKRLADSAVVWLNVSFANSHRLLHICKNCGNCFPLLLFPRYRNIHQWLTYGGSDGNRFHQAYRFALWRLQHWWISHKDFYYMKKKLFAFLNLSRDKLQNKKASP